MRFFKFGLKKNWREVEDLTKLKCNYCTLPLSEGKMYDRTEWECALEDSRYRHVDICQEIFDIVNPYAQPSKNDRRLVNALIGSYLHTPKFREYGKKLLDDIAKRAAKIEGDGKRRDKQLIDKTFG